MRRDDPKVQYLEVDQRIRWDGNIYRNTEMRDVRQGTEVFVEVYCEALWYDLQKRVRPGNYPVLGETVEQGLATILTNTGWNVGTTPSDATLYSIEANDATIIQLLRSWSAVTGYELDFNTATQTVNMSTGVGSPIQVPFRYGRNLTKVERRYEPPVSTRLYAYGAASLTIAASNPTGQEYVEDYSWYTALGLTPAEAEARHRKDQVWVDERYLLGINLYDAAVARLARLAQPVISYDVDVIDLSAQLGLVEGGYTIGDTVQVFDEELGLDLSTRIVRTRKQPRNRQRNSVELEYLRPGLSDSQLALDQRAIDYNKIAVLVDENGDPLTLSSSTTRWAEIAITVSGVTTPVLGATLIGVPSGGGGGTMDVYATVDGSDIGVRMEVSWTGSADIVEFSWPTYVADLDEGSYVVDWRATVTSGADTIAVAAGGARAWMLVQGAVGVGFATTPNQFITETVAEFDIGTMSDGVTAVVAVVDEIVTVSDAATGYEPATIIDRYNLPFQLNNPVFGRLGGVGRLGQPSPEEVTT